MPLIADDLETPNVRNFSARRQPWWYFLEVMQRRKSSPRKNNTLQSGLKWQIELHSNNYKI
jgi:hypothetical protein